MQLWLVLGCAICWFWGSRGNIIADPKLIRLELYSCPPVGIMVSPLGLLKLGIPGSYAAQIVSQVLSMLKR